MRLSRRPDWLLALPTFHVAGLDEICPDKYLHRLNVVLCATESFGV